jgi:hypothetical protein
MAAASLAGMFVLVFLESLVNVGSLACKDPEKGCLIEQICISLFLASVILRKEKISPLSGKALFHFREGTVYTVKHAYGTEERLSRLRQGDGRNDQG